MTRAQWYVSSSLVLSSNGIDRIRLTFAAGRVRDKRQYLQELRQDPEATPSQIARLEDECKALGNGQIESPYVETDQFSCQFSVSMQRDERNGRWYGSHLDEATLSPVVARAISRLVDAGIKHDGAKSIEILKAKRIRWHEAGSQWVETDKIAFIDRTNP